MFGVSCQDNVKSSLLLMILMSWLGNYFRLEFWLARFVQSFLTNWGSPLCSGACHWANPKFALRPFRPLDIASSGTCNACERAKAAERCRAKILTTFFLKVCNTSTVHGLGAEKLWNSFQGVHHRPESDLWCFSVLTIWVFTEVPICLQEIQGPGCWWCKFILLPFASELNVLPRLKSTNSCCLSTST